MANIQTLRTSHFAAGTHRPSTWPGDLVLAQEGKEDRRAQGCAATRRGHGPIQVRHAAE